MTHLVLIVEDDVILAKLFEKAMQYAGYQTIITHSGKDVVTLLDTYEPALILLDLGLPEVSGMDILQAIQVHRQTHGLKVIVVSGNHHTVEAIDYELVDLTFIKPVSIRELTVMASRLFFDQAIA